MTIEIHSTQESLTLRDFLSIFHRQIDFFDAERARYFQSIFKTYREYLQDFESLKVGRRGKRFRLILYYWYYAEPLLRRANFAL